MSKLSFLFRVAILFLLISCGKDDDVPDVDPPTDEGEFSQVGTIQGPAGETIASIAISRDGQAMAYGTFADNLIRIINIETQEEARTLSGHTNVVTALDFSPDGELLASTGTVNLGEEDGTVRVWNVSSGTQIALVATAPEGTNDLAFSPDGSMLGGASVGNPLSIRLWNASNLNNIRNIPGVFRMISFSPDGSRIATGKRDDEVHIIEVATGSEIISYGGHTGWVQSVAYSPDGQLIATGGEDRTILVRDVQSGQITHTFEGHTSFPDRLHFSPGMSMMASLGSGINITRTNGGIEVRFGDSDRFIRLWDMDSGTELPSLDTGSDVITTAAISADWSVLVTGSENGLIRIFSKD